MADVRTFKVAENLHQSALDHKMLYTDRPSKDEQLYRKTIFGKDKK
jgi:hypothetical protein